MRKPASDSVAGQLQAAADKEYEYYVPETLPKLTKAQKVYWDLYITARNAWKDSDLVELHALCQMKAKHAEMLADDDYSHTEQVAQAKLIQAQLRVIGLNIAPNVATAVAREGQPSSSRGKRPAPESTKSVSLIR